MKTHGDKTRHIYGLLFVLLQAACGALPAYSLADDITITDDSGAALTLARPAQRIVSLAPHLTELAFSAGAQGQLVGVSEHCDYPAQVRHIAKVSDYRSVNYELLTLLKPDLILAWAAAMRPGMLKNLRAIGPVYVSDPSEFADIAANLEAIGALSGHRDTARRLSARFTDDMTRLQESVPAGPRLKVFYLLWNPPPMTVTRRSWISQTIEMCGGNNIYSGSGAHAPVIDREFLFAAETDLMIQSIRETFDSELSLSLFGRPIPTIYAAPDTLQRPSLRLLDSAAYVCREITRIRSRPKN